MSNGLYNGLDNGLHNGVYNGMLDGVSNGLLNIDHKKTVKDLLLFLDAGNRNSYSPNSSGTKWNDLTLNNYNGVLTCNPWYLNGPTFNYGNKGYINCDGINDYIEVENSDKLKFGTDDFTIEYWVRKKITTVGANWNNVWGVNKWETGGKPGENEWSISLGSFNVDALFFVVESGVNSYTTGAFPLNINQWYQVVGIRNGDKLQLYVNGDLKQSYVHPFFTRQSSVNNSGKKIRISNSYLNQFYTGADTAVLRIYKKALCKEEVLWNFNELRGRFGL